MANLVVAMNMKRKDAEVATHGFSIFLDPKRAKLQDAEVSVMMEEEEPLPNGHAPAAHVQPTVFMRSPLLPTLGQEALSDSTVSNASGSKCSEPTFSADQAAPMNVEVELQQCQDLEQHAPFFSGFF